MPSIQCESPSSFRHELESIRAVVSLPETEESWDKIAKSITLLTALCNDGGACNYPAELTASVRTISRPLTSAMNSERTRLSGAAIDCVCALATGLGTAFDPLLPLFMPTVITLCTRTNKVFIKRANACLVSVIEGTQLPSILPYLLEAVKDKSAYLRLAATEGVLRCLNCFNPPDLEKESRARDVEAVIKATVRDANVDVRKASRKVFEAYKILLPNRVNNFVSPLTPIAKKYLDIKQTTTQVTRSTTAPALSTSTRPPISHTRSTPAELNAHPQSSASSSNLALSHAHPLQTHMRSASSSALPATVAAKPSRDMPPPNFIPVRPAQPPKIAPSSRPPSRPTSAASTRSDGPARPKSATEFAAQAAPKPAVRLTQSQSSSGAARRGKHPPEPPAPAPKSGPLRMPSGSTSKPAGSETAQERVKGGARRVPIPPPATSKEEEKPKENEKTPIAPPPRVRTISRPVKSTPAPAPTTRAEAISKSTHTTAASSKVNTTAPPKPVSTATKANEKAKPAPRAAQPVTSSTDATKPATKAAPRGGVTQPTLAQLARVTTKPLVPRKAAEAAKPGWGMTRKASAPTLRTKASTTSLKSASSDTTKKVKKGASSGRTTPAPAMVPLPPSPVPEGEGEKEDEAGEEAEKELEVAKEELIEATEGDDANESTPSSEPAQQEATERALTPPLESAVIPSGSSSHPPTSLAVDATRTPISALVSSIQRGFLFTPSSPLSPPQGYLTLPPRMGPGLAPGLAGMKFGIAPGLANVAVADKDEGRGVLNEVEGNHQ